MTEDTRPDGWTRAELLKDHLADARADAAFWRRNYELMVRIIAESVPDPKEVEAMDDRVRARFEDET